MPEEKKVPFTVILQAIERIREQGRLQQFNAECGTKGYEVVMPAALYDLGADIIRSSDPSQSASGTNLELGGTGVCDLLPPSR